MAMPCLTRLVADFSPRSPGFISRSVDVGFVVDSVALGQVSPRVLPFSPVSIIPPLPHIHSYIIWGLDNGSVSGCSARDIFSAHRINTSNKKPYRVTTLNSYGIQPHRRIGQGSLRKRSISFLLRNGE
jgi:hypothetical protein